MIDRRDLLLSSGLLTKYIMPVQINVPRYGNTQVVAQTFDELRSLSSRRIEEGYSAIVAGGLSPADGLGGMFVWTPSSTVPDDGQTIIAPADGQPGRWHKIAVGQTGGQGGPGPLGPKGDPGGNVLAIGLFSVAREMTITADLVQTSGFTSIGVGAAHYAFDPAVDAAYVTAHPLSSFMSAQNRGYRYSSIGSVNPEQFGAIGDGATDDSAAFIVAEAHPGKLETLNGNYFINEPVTVTDVAQSGNTRFTLGPAALLTIAGKFDAGPRQVLFGHGENVRLLDAIDLNCVRLEWWGMSQTKSFADNHAAAWQAREACRLGCGSVRLRLPAGQIDIDCNIFPSGFRTCIMLGAPNTGTKIRHSQNADTFAASPMFGNYGEMIHPNYLSADACHIVSNSSGIPVGQENPGYRIASAKAGDTIIEFLDAGSAATFNAGDRMRLYGFVLQPNKGYPPSVREFEIVTVEASNPATNKILLAAPIGADYSQAWPFFDSGYANPYQPWGPARALSLDRPDAYHRTGYLRVEDVEYLPSGLDTGVGNPPDGLIQIQGIERTELIRCVAPGLSVTLTGTVLLKDSRFGTAGKECEWDRMTDTVEVDNTTLIGMHAGSSVHRISIRNGSKLIDCGWNPLQMLEIDETSTVIASVNNTATGVLAGSSPIRTRVVRLRSGSKFIVNSPNARDLVQLSGGDGMYFTVASATLFANHGEIKCSFGTPYGSDGWSGLAAMDAGVILTDYSNDVIVRVRDIAGGTFNDSGGTITIITDPWYGSGPVVGATLYYNTTGSVEVEDGVQIAGTYANRIQKPTHNNPARDRAYDLVSCNVTEEQMMFDQSGAYSPITSGGSQGNVMLPIEGVVQEIQCDVRKAYTGASPSAQLTLSGPEVSYTAINLKQVGFRCYTRNANTILSGDSAPETLLGGTRPRMIYLGLGIAGATAPLFTDTSQLAQFNLTIITRKDRRAS